MKEMHALLSFYKPQVTVWLEQNVYIGHQTDRAYVLE